MLNALGFHLYLRAKLSKFRTGLALVGGSIRDLKRDFTDLCITIDASRVTSLEVWLHSMALEGDLDPNGRIMGAHHRKTLLGRKTT